MNNQENQIRAKLCAKSVVNEYNGASYENHDISKMNMQFDLDWEEVYGYHPIEAADWEKGFNGVEG
ncbi:MAG: hypothetical protein CMK89_21470 [Pseudomonadales bacterium]|jgi:hypothetical protein|nr:hypothetical protein [Pseudomonadales bacterium]